MTAQGHYQNGQAKTGKGTKLVIQYQNSKASKSPKHKADKTKAKARSEKQGRCKNWARARQDDGWRVV